MTALLIDIGNTRVKWARWEKGRMGRQHALAHADWNAKVFERGVGRAVDEVVVVSVAGAKMNRLVSRTVRSVFGVAPRFVRSARRLGRVTTRYQEPWRLGTDRLVAAVGGHHLARGRPVCVVDIGTAMTIDLVDARGVHLGGAILPGPSLMIDSLLQDTSGIQRRAGSVPGSVRRSGTAQFFARDTRAAVERGARYATAAVIDRAVVEAKAVLGRAPLVLLTGGAAGGVQGFIRTRHRLVPDLVLRGLAHLA